MGIDCYLTTRERRAKSELLYAQCAAGKKKYSDIKPPKDLGYIRESYHGGPYITRLLFPECFVSLRDMGLQDVEDVDLGSMSYSFDFVGEPKLLWARFGRHEDAIEERAIEVYNDPQFGKEQRKTVLKFLKTYEKLWNEKKQPVVWISY